MDINTDMINLNYNKEIIIFDDLGLKYATDELYSIVTNNFFPWYFTPRTIIEPEFQPTYNKEEFGEYEFMQHLFVSNYTENSPNMGIAVKMLDMFSEKSGIKFSKIVRAQANFIEEKKMAKPSAPHTDYADPHYVMLVYLNDSDGDTVFYTEDLIETQRVSPKSGRFVVFDGSIIHSATPPVETKNRIVFSSFIC
jgi:hypothetical protein